MVGYVTLFGGWDSEAVVQGLICWKTSGETVYIHPCNPVIVLISMISPSRIFHQLKNRSVRDVLREETVRSLSNISYNPESIWDRDWDLLIVLDACRYDLMESVESEYAYLDRKDNIVSVGSSTIEWLEQTFSEKYESEISKTAYITGNPNSIRAFPYHYPNECGCGATLDPTYNSIYHEGIVVCSSCNSEVHGNRYVPVKQLEEVWREGWRNDLGTIPPRPITDSAIQVHRRYSPEKMIIHYMQPHHPFISAPGLDQGSYIAEGDRYREKLSKTIWEQLEAGELDTGTVWEEYRNNLRIVLDDLELLLNNVDSELTVISSDHGNAMGEYSVYGHPGNMPLDCLVNVPWYTTSGSDEEEYQPTQINNGNQSVSSEEITERLRDLGYRE